METFDVLEEGARSLVLLGALGFLLWQGAVRQARSQRGWPFFVLGISTMLAASVIDLVDEFPLYDTWPAALVGDRGLLEFFTEDIAPIGAVACILAGFVLWLPLPSRLADRMASNRQAWDTLLANAPDYILLIDEDERVAYANRTPGGMKVADVVGKPISAFVADPVQREAMLHAVRQALRGGAPSNVEVQGPGHMGSLASYSLRIMPSVMPDGRRAALMLNVDVTEMLHARAAVEDRQAKLEEAQAIAHIGSWETDLATGLVHESMEGWRILGLPGTPMPLPITRFLSHIHPDDQATMNAAVEKALAQGDDYQLLLRVRGPEHRDWRQVNVRGHAGQRDDHGKVKTLVGTVEDVTDRQADQRRLAESEERFRLAGQAARDVIWDLDLRTLHLTWGGALQAVFGHDPEAMHELSSWTGRIHPDDHDRVDAGFTAALAGDALQWQDEYRFRKADGSYAEVLDRGLIVRDAAGKGVRAVGSMTDVTELREAGRAIRRKEAQYRTLAENFPDYISRVDRDLKRIYVNPATKALWQRMAGVDPEGTRISDITITKPADRAELEAMVREAFATGEPRPLRQVARLPEGSRHLHGTVVPERGPDGHVESALIVARDITDVVRAQQALEQMAQDLRQAQRIARVGSWESDLVEQTSQWSDEFWPILGLARGARPASTQTYLACVHPDDRERVRRILGGCLDAGQPAQYECRIVRPDGVAWSFARLVPTVRDGKVVHMTGIIQDITDQRRLEDDLRAARQRDAEHEREALRLKEMADFKTQFLSNAAHELATPLTPLKLQLATMRQGPIARADAAGFELLERNVHRLGTLVDDLLDAARLQSGGLRLRPAEVVVPDLLGRVAATFKEQARVAGVTLGVHPAVGRLRLRCDETRVEQVLFNLVHNALKFTPRGGQVWLRERIDGGHLVLEVADTGIGLEPAQAQRLFQPFSQVHDTGKVKAGGTGLGLYIARGIAQQHGGDLAVSSPGAGHGTTFALRLPLSSPPSGPAPASASSTATAPAPARGGGAPGARPEGP